MGCSEVVRASYGGTGIGNSAPRNAAVCYRIASLSAIALSYIIIDCRIVLEFMEDGRASTALGFEVGCLAVLSSTAP